MGYLIGIDEAGYAPNLGPLVIAATLWRIPGSPRRCGDLYDRLSSIICRELPKSRKNGAQRTDDPPRLPIGDSKQLYNPQLGLRVLEHSVLTMLRCAAVRARDCRALWEQLAPAALAEINAAPWHEQFNPRLPIAAGRRELAEGLGRVRNGLRSARVRLLAVRARLIFPARFNALVDQLGSKGAALSRETVGLLGELLPRCGNHPILVTGDKHGGRNCYAPFLQQQFDEHLVEIYGEGAAESVYRFGPAERRVEVRFRVRGEEWLPVALASMVAKYLRELSMKAFNEFWCARVPDLRATAGYPADAHRFKQQIAGAQSLLGIEDHILWRAR